MNKYFRLLLLALGGLLLSHREAVSQWEGFAARKIGPNGSFGLARGSTVRLGSTGPTRRYSRGLQSKHMPMELRTSSI